MTHGGRARVLAASFGFAADDVLDLSASLHPTAPDVRVVAARVLDELRYYPSDLVARDALASAIGVAPDLVVLTNGASEAIALVAAHLGAGAVSEPEFALYARHLPLVNDDAPRWRSNPNNPLGTLAPADATAGVWDESFYAIATGRWTRGDLGAFRIGSLTKVWACPGLRLGYVICPDAAAADAISLARPQWSVNGIAAAIVEPMLAATDLGAMHAEMTQLRGALVALLDRFERKITEPSANWVLVDDGRDLIDELPKQGVFVRDCTNFGLTDTVRIAVPTEADLARLAVALERM